MVSSKSINNIIPLIEEEFKKISEIDKCENFLNDVKKRLEVLTDIYYKLSKLVVFNSNMTSKNPCRENLPRVLKSSCSSRSNLILPRDCTHQSVQLEPINIELSKKIFSPLNRNNNIVKNKSHFESIKCYKDKILWESPFISNTKLNYSKNCDINPQRIKHENQNIILKSHANNKNVSINKRGNASVFNYRSISVNNDKDKSRTDFSTKLKQGKRVQLNLKSDLPEKIIPKNKTIIIGNVKNNLKLLKTVGHNKLSLFTNEKNLSDHNFIYQKCK